MAKGIPEGERRRQILDRSASLFFQRGVSALTMDGIASLQGISKKTLYRFFPNKEALLSEVLEGRAAAVAAEAVRLGRDTALPWLERIRRIFAVVGRQIAQLSETLVRDIYYNEPELWERLDRFRREHVFTIIIRLLEEGRRKGFIRGDIDGELVPLLFTNAISAVLTPSQLVNLPFAPAKLFDAFISILFGGILSDTARRAFFAQEKKT